MIVLCLKLLKQLIIQKRLNVPIIIAINKMDKPEANPTKTKNDLLEHELIVEEARW